MKLCGFGIGALMALGGCASAPMVPMPQHEVGQVEPCRPHGSGDSEEATQTFGTCLAMADGLAAARKPTAAVPEATHWDLPVMQRFIAGTTHGSGG